MMKIVRHGSTLAKLWVKYNGSQPIKVSTADCNDISDFAKAIKRELSPTLNAYASHQLTLHKTLDDAALRPGLTIADLLKALETNTDESPLIVKTQGLTTTPQKTIFIQDIDEDCRPLDTFTEYVVRDDASLRRILGQKASALRLLSNPTKAFAEFKDLVEGEKYRATSLYEQSFVKEVRWQQNEDRAMENEIFLKLREFLLKELGQSVTELPRVIKKADGKPAQEWEGIFQVGDTLYLCEAKHNMTLKQVNKLPERIAKFKEFQVNAQPEFRSARKYVGVLCGTFFPEDIRNNAHLLGFICVYPCGNRYDVKKAEDFIIER